MLNTRQYLAFIFLCILICNSSFNLRCQINSDINESDELKRLIQSINYSDNKKALNALVTRELISLDINDPDVINDYFELYFLHIKNMLNQNQIVNALDFINILKPHCLNKNNIIQWNYWFHLGLIYNYSDNYKKAEDSFEKALEKIDKEQNTSEMDRTIHQQGLMYYYKKDKEESLKYFIQVSQHSKHPFRLFDANRRIASTLSILGKHKEALFYANKAIQSQLLSEDYVVNEKFDSVLNLDVYGSALQSRSYIYRQMANESPDSIKLLELALQDAQNSVLSLEKHKRNLIFESDLLNLNSNYKYFNFKVIESISRLKRATNSNEYNDLALRYAELDKISALLRSVQKDIALHQSNIPDSIINHINNLYEELATIEATRYHEKANIRIEEEHLFELNLSLYDLITEISNLEDSLETTFPNYKEEKFKIELPNLDYVKTLSKEKSILEYVVSDEKVYAFLINDGEVYFNNFQYRKDFIQDIKTLKLLVSEGHKLDYSKQEQIEFERLSHGLYIDLIKPFEHLITKKSLLIVPDEYLALIPFEILIKSKSSGKSVNYSKLDYLVKHFDISYTYSLTLLKKQSELTNRLKQNTLFAIAPGYNMLNSEDSNQYYTFRDTQNQLTELKGAKEEVEKVSKRIKGKALLDKNASEAAFKKNAGNYKVLHLAMHTWVNDDNPLYSKLIFTPDVDDSEDGMLNTYELSSLDLNADLVVLSACNTGFGKVNKGEGIIGLSRGFFQAGCKSLLATLWSVSDDASTGIINEFYNDLDNNWTKSRSLSESKRNYLNNTKGTLAHPFFWAGYIAIGNDDPIKLEKKRLKYAGMALIVVLVILGIIIYSKKGKAGRTPGFQSN